MLVRTGAGFDELLAHDTSKAAHETGRQWPSTSLVVLRSAETLLPVLIRKSAVVKPAAKPDFTLIRALVIGAWERGHLARPEVNSIQLNP